MKNNFLKKKFGLVDWRQSTNPNYGLSQSFLFTNTHKYNCSNKTFTKKSLFFFHTLMEKKAHLFNRFLKIRKKQKIEEIKKQSSWKSLRLKQGLPLNGQRTHTNASVAKKINSSMSIFNL